MSVVLNESDVICKIFMNENDVKCLYNSMTSLNSELCTKKGGVLKNIVHVQKLEANQSESCKNRNNIFL